MRTFALATRIAKEILRDKRTLALMMIAPLLLMSLVSVLFNTYDNVNLVLGVHQVDSNIIELLEEQEVNVIEIQEDEDVTNLIENNKLDAYLTQTDKELNITFDNSDPSITKQLQGKLQAVLIQAQMSDMKDSIDSLSGVIEKLNPSLISDNQQPQTWNTVSNYVYADENFDFFEMIFPIFIGFFVFFFVFLVSGIALIKEKTSGTLSRLLATPIKRSELVFGYLLGYGTFAMIQTLLIVLFSIYILNMNVSGNIGLIFLINLIFALVALTFGMLLSTFARSEFQMMQFIPVIIVPQIFFSGIISLESMPNWLQAIGNIMPLKYAGHALMGIANKGYGFLDIQMDFFILCIFCLIFLCLNIIGLKKYRKI